MFLWQEVRQQTKQTNKATNNQQQHVEHPIHLIHKRSQQVLSGQLERNVNGPFHRNAATGRNLH
jgi:hypothetical protein